MPGWPRCGLKRGKRAGYNQGHVPQPHRRDLVRPVDACRGLHWRSNPPPKSSTLFQRDGAKEWRSALSVGPQWAGRCGNGASELEEHHRRPSCLRQMRYRLRTLLIVLAVGPVMLAAVHNALVEAERRETERIAMTIVQALAECPPCVGPKP